MDPGPLVEDKLCVFLILRSFKFGIAVANEPVHDRINHLCLCGVIRQAHQGFDIGVIAWRFAHHADQLVNGANILWQTDVLADKRAEQHQKVNDCSKDERQERVRMQII